jgi:flagellar biosynthesis component FlhA
MVALSAIRFRMSFMIRFFLSRVGCLLLIVGSIILILGVAAEWSGQPAFEFIIIGSALLFLGFLLWNRRRSKKHKRSRFSILRGRESREEPDQEDGWQEDDDYV